jgi:hypothetical protein
MYKSVIGPLASALGDLQQATAWLMRHAAASPDDGAAGATDYLHLMGLVALGYMWCRIVEAEPGSPWTRPPKACATSSRPAVSQIRGPGGR